MQAEQVFASLYAAHVALIRHIARNQYPCCAVIDAGDYESAMLVTLWRLALRHPETAERRAYVVTALRHACADLWRRWQATAHYECPMVWDGQMPRLEPVTPGPEAGDAAREALAAASRLQARLRRPLLLYAFGWRRREIARLLGRRPHTVSVQIREAQRLMRRAAASGR